MGQTLNLSVFWNERVSFHWKRGRTYLEFLQRNGGNGSWLMVRQKKEPPVRGRESVLASGSSRETTDRKKRLFS